MAYPALALAVELLRGGELMYSYARTLSDRGWGLLVDLEEQVNCLQTCAQSADGCLAVSAERPEAVRTLWGDRAESIAQLAQGRRVHLTVQGVSELMFGQKVAFFEVFCGQMHLTVGVRAMGLCAPDGVDKLYPIGGKPWDLTRAPDQKKCQDLLDGLDPWITHFAPPCTELSIIGSRPEPGSDSLRRVSPL